MGSCPQIENAALLAVGLLTGPEQEAYERHTAVCPACRIEVAELRAVVDLLPYGAVPAEPDPDLLPVILERLDEPTMASSAEEDLAAPAPVAAVATAGGRLPTWAMAALFTLILAAGGLSWGLVAVSRQVTELSRGGQTVAAVRLVRLGPTEVAPAAHADLVVWPGQAGGAHLMLMANGLPPAGSPQVYHLWLVQDGLRSSGGTFTVDEQGKGYLYRTLEAPPQFNTAGVTLEPDSGGPGPRGPRVLAGRL